MYYGLEGVILWGSITVQSVPSSEGGGGGDGAGFDGPQVTSCLRVCQHLWLGSSVVSCLKPDVRRRLPFPHWLSLSYWGQGGIPRFWSRSPECQARSGCVPQVCTLPSPSTATLATEGQEEHVLVRKITISPSNEYSGLIFFRIDWFDLLAVQETLRSLLQYHSSKASTF